MNLSVLERSDTLTVLQLEGSLNLAGVQAMESRFRELTAGKGNPVVLDFAKVDFIASMGMRLLVEACKALARDQKKLVIFRPQPKVAKVLDAAGLTNILVIADDEAAARAAVAP